MLRTLMQLYFQIILKVTLVPVQSQDTFFYDTTARAYSLSKLHDYTQTQHSR